MTLPRRTSRAVRICLVAVLLALPTFLPLQAQARGYTPNGQCGGFDRLDIATPAATCVALVADETQGLRAPRRILEVAPGRYWIIDMGSWERHQGRLLEMTLPIPGQSPHRASIKVLAEKLDRPLGLAIGPDGKAYIGEAGSIWRTAVSVPLQREPVITQLPDDGAHPLKELAFGPDGALYVNMGSFSDACRNEQQQQPMPCPELRGESPRAAVYVASFQGPQRSLANFKPFSTGLRNSLALAVLPQGPAPGTVLQGENSIDYPEVGEPAEKLNRLQAGRYYGWPYCVEHQRPARGYEKRYDCRASEPPLQLWPAHAAPLHMLVGPANSLFAGQLLVAWHGHKPAGHRVVSYAIQAGGKIATRPRQLLSGWDARAGVRPLGKPTGLAIDSQGRLLIVEDFNRTVLMLLPLTAGAPTNPSIQ